MICNQLFPTPCPGADDTVLLLVSIIIMRDVVNNLLISKFFILFIPVKCAPHSPQYHIPELPQLNTLKGPGSTGQAPVESSIGGPLRGIQRGTAG